MTYYCPRCRDRTLAPEGDMLVCRQCGFAVWIEVLEFKTVCVTPEDVEQRLPPHLKHKILEFLRQGKLVFVKKFDIRTGVECMCLEPRKIKDSEALEVLRRVETLLHGSSTR